MAKREDWDFPEKRSEESGRPVDQAFGEVREAKGQDPIND